MTKSFAKRKKYIPALRVPVCRFRWLSKRVFDVWGAFVRAPVFKYRKSFVNGICVFEWSHHEQILTVSVGPIARVDHMQLIFTETRPSAVIPDQTVANTIAQTSTNSALRQQMVLWRPHRDRVRMRWPFPMISGGNGHRGVKNGDGRGLLDDFSSSRKRRFLTPKDVSIFFWHQKTCLKNWSRPPRKSYV